MDGIWDWLTSPFSGGSSPGGYSGLTPDQQQMVAQQGWFPRPDMVMPTGQSLQQPAGYSNLTPAQAATVGGLGYFSNPDAQPGGGDSLLSKIAAGLGSPGGKDAIKDLQAAMQGPQPLPGRIAPSPTAPPGLLSANPYHNLYSRAPLDPKQALASFQRGY
jgi:hypothetical protein